MPCQQGSTPTDKPKEKPMFGFIIRLVLNWFTIEIEIRF